VGGNANRASTSQFELQMVWKSAGCNSQSDTMISKGATKWFYQLNARTPMRRGPGKLAAAGAAPRWRGGGQLIVSVASWPESKIASAVCRGKNSKHSQAAPATAKLVVDLQQTEALRGLKAKSVCWVCRISHRPAKKGNHERTIRKFYFDLTVDPKLRARLIQEFVLRRGMVPDDRSDDPAQHRPLERHSGSCRRKNGGRPVKGANATGKTPESDHVFANCQRSKARASFWKAGWALAFARS